VGDIFVSRKAKTKKHRETNAKDTDQQLFVFVFEMFHPPKLLDSNKNTSQNASKASKKSMESCINTTPNKKFTPTSSNKAQHKDWQCNSCCAW